MNRRSFMKAATAASWCDLDFVRTAIEMAEHNPAIAEYLEYSQGGLSTFRPRTDDPDAPGCPDEQTAFCNSKERVAFLIGGNGAGTSVAAAYKAARFMLKEQPPPRHHTPYWVMSNTFENTCNVCWGEKLHGMGFIPQCEIDRVIYHSEARNQPKAVVLKPWPGLPNKNWVIEFKTFEQRQSAMMGASIGGFWISETPPSKLVAETARGLRDYDFLGACLIEFTPIDPWLSMEMEAAIEKHSRLKSGDEWRVYRANTMCNLPNLPGGQAWVDTMLAFTPEELWNTRLYGDFSVFEHQIFTLFRDDTHIVDVDSDQGREMDRRVLEDRSLIHSMGTDWGWSSEHAQAQVWGAWDPEDGSWYVYDEYWTVSQDRIILDHVEETLSRCEQWNWPVVKDSRGRLRIELSKRVGYGQNHADSAESEHCRQYNIWGVPTVAYSKTRGSVINGINYIKWMLMSQPETGRPLLKVASRCKHLIDEMHKYRWKRGQTNMMALNPSLAVPEPLPRFDHAIDAMRYMVMGTRRYEGWDSSPKMKHALEHADRQAAQAHVNLNRRSWSNGGGARGLVRFTR